MGEGIVIEAPHNVISSGLGSCVVVTLYNPYQKIGGMAHIMLPDSKSCNGHQTPYQCADTAIATLLEELRSKGAVLQNLVAKMVGGAQMFSQYEDSNPGIGEQNIKSVGHILKNEKIPLVGEDTGGHHGRNVEFQLDSGKVIVTTIEKEIREI